MSLPHLTKILELSGCSVTKMTGGIKNLFFLILLLSFQLFSVVGMGIIFLLFRLCNTMPTVGTREILVELVRPGRAKLLCRQTLFYYALLY